ncbi:HD domain-containing protein [Ostreibacterium oceani]|uniref:HD domain-containing protein n=1 Tax=Ostreibacterium oceani TaxID=2654998 RepID=A0A6N7ESJ9_9GAMM|nr:HD domain-containing protein [Ostreibacterium oceani]MPV85521.1 HD domain-containing protein [Ostreibacterium oceani]
MKTVKFTQMKTGDAEDYSLLETLESDYASATGARLIQALSTLEETLSGYQVSRLTHSLQTATRAYYDGADDDWIVAALLHDIGDVYAPLNHSEYAASILAPFVREQCRWVVEKHGDFQLQYYGEFVGGDKNQRQQYAGHRYFDDCDYFCEHWDQASFDPNYPTKPLTFFEPIVLRVFARKAYDPAVIRAGERVPPYCFETAQSRQ